MCEVRKRAFWGADPVKKELEDTRASGTPEMPQKKYNIIYADPPWSYSDKGCNGNAEDHYHTMSLADICKLPINTAGGHRCRRLRVVHVGHIPHDGGSLGSDQGMGFHL